MSKAKRLVLSKIIVFFSAVIGLFLCIFIHFKNNEVDSKSSLSKVMSNQVSLATTNSDFVVENQGENNSVDCATVITGPEDYQNEEYDYSIYTNIWYDDHDYYSIVLLSDSYITIEVKAEDSPYSYEYGFYRVANDDSFDFIDGEMGTSLYRSTENEYAEAGVYYIELASNGAYDYKYEVRYRLNVYVKMADEIKNYDIGELRYKKGLSGALWVSDYIPFDNTEPFSFDFAYNYKELYTKNAYQSRWIFNYLNEVSSNDKITLLSCYIWDYPLISDLQKILTALEDSYNKAEYDAKIHNAKVDSIVNSVEGGQNKMTIYFDLLDQIGNILHKESISIALNVASILSNSIYKFILNNMLAEKIDINKGYGENLQDLRLTLAGSRITSDGGADTVVYNPLAFSLYYRASFSEPNIELEYIPFERMEKNNDEYVYTSVKIPSLQGYSNGSLYAIDSLDDSFNINELKKVESYQYVEPDIIPIKTESEFFAPTGYGGITWYSYTAKSSGKHSIYTLRNCSEIVYNYDTVSHVLSLYREKPTTIDGDNYVTTNIGGFYNGSKIGTLVNIDLKLNETIYIKLSGRFGKGYLEGIINACLGLPYMEPLPEEPTPDPDPDPDPDPGTCIHRLEGVKIMGPDGWYQKCSKCGELVKVSGLRKSQVILPRKYDGEKKYK